MSSKQNHFSLQQSTPSNKIFDTFDRKISRFRSRAKEKNLLLQIRCSISKIKQCFRRVKVIFNLVDSGIRCPNFRLWVFDGFFSCWTNCGSFFRISATNSSERSCNISRWSMICIPCRQVSCTNAFSCLLRWLDGKIFPAFIPVSRHRLGLVQRKTLVLDLDETLIHSHHDGLPRNPSIKPGTPHDFTVSYTAREKSIFHSFSNKKKIFGGASCEKKKKNEMKEIEEWNFHFMCALGPASIRCFRNR